MARPIVYVALVATLAAIVVADFGPCTFDENLCSCKYGSPTQGRCWDHVTNTPGICASRWCNAGWTCACGGRTHTCYIHRHFPIKIADGDKQKETAPCPIDPATNQPGVEAKDSASEPEISLGAFKFEISPKGVAANDCNEVAWWHNGNLQTVYNSLSGDDAANMNITKELDDRENHYLMELRGGDVLSFRYKASSYYCQIHKMELTVNGTVVTDLFSNPLINITYAREHSTGWFLPLFSPNYGEGESEADLALFLPPRPSMFNGSAIAPDANVDWWSPPVQSDPDLKTSNWYWRIVLDPSFTTTAATPSTLKLTV